MYDIEEEYIIVYHVILLYSCLGSPCNVMVSSVHHGAPRRAIVFDDTHNVRPGVYRSVTWNTVA